MSTHWTDVARNPANAMALLRDRFKEVRAEDLAVAGQDPDRLAERLAPRHDLTPSEARSVIEDLALVDHLRRHRGAQRFAAE